MTASADRFDAIIVAGGSSTRFGSDKLAVVLDGRSVLDHVRDAVVGAATVSIVGPEVQGGPVPAIAAGLTAGTADTVVVVAGDQPYLNGAIEALVGAVPPGGVAVLIREGRRQYLTAAWDRGALVEALATLGELTDQRVRALLDGVPVIEVVDMAGWSRDIDTLDDLP